ncbi:exoglucanase-6A [Verticillium alfalfae VaMs.102]|uniref:Glucanase n=1 Tax=Verticillium alfalfae (strain VaMs.102 / ATCC MYA-4576 / FGSC 10136) TaxID=526221 RepID=C9SYI3_VERA1|nr:exoglucanase-6A [Verticillium alfalfae VaMs.102]EEY23848.1 exoglucanase-6A [Verticillium alfalfae VaMs.102]
MSTKSFLVAAALTTVALAVPHRNKCRDVATYEGNPLADVQLYPDPYYVNEIETLAIPQIEDEELVAAAKAVTKISTFQWLTSDKISKLDLLNSTLHEIRAANDAGASPPYAATIVVYNFPDRDCSAKASAGELILAEDGLNRYKTEYIDPIAALIKKFSDIRTVIAYEPDGLANLVTNMAVEKCANAASAYREATEYGLATLNFANVAIYVDAGHAGWLGWDGNLQPTAELYAELYKNAGSPKAVRGVVTNVSNFNGYNLTTPPAYTEPNAQWDESKFHDALAPHLETAGYPAHFIVDQGRSGVQPGLRSAWSHWCNINGTGFGPRPTTEIADEITDAIVWIKPGGESDGTSDETAVRFDENCHSPSAFQPAPEAGGWFQAYFEMLLKNANPPLA